MKAESKEILGFDKAMFMQCIILFLGMCGGVWINKYIYIFVAFFTVLVCLFTNVKNVYYHLLFSVSFTVIYKLDPASTSLFAYVMIVTGIILIGRIKKFHRKTFYFMFFFSLYLLVGMGENYTTVFKMIMGIILLYFFVRTTEEKDFKNHIMAFTLGVIGSSFIGTFRNSLPQLSAYFWNTYTVFDGSDLAYRFTGLNYDPNYYSVSVIFAIVLCLILITNKTGHWAFVWSTVVTLAVFGFQSYSKMFLLSFAAVAIIFMMYMMRPSKIILNVAVPLLIVGTGVIVWLQSLGYMDMMFVRFSNMDVFSGRVGLWKYYIQYIVQSVKVLLLGEGLGADYLPVGGPHNTYLEAVYFIGALGSVLLLCMIISILGCKKYNNKRSLINYLLIFAFVLVNGALGCFTINDMSFYGMLIWMGLNIDITKTNGRLIEREI